VAVFPDGRQAISGSEDGALRLWNLETGAALGERGRQPGGIGSLAVFPDGRQVLIGLSDGTLRLTDIGDSKGVIRYFVSFSRTDKRLKENLLVRLRSRFGAAKNYRFVGWEDSEIEVGSDWHEEIQAAIAKSDFGLLFVSPGFLANPYISSYELPNFKRIVPVALERIAFDGSMDLRGLERRQVFHDRDRRAYQELKGSKRNDFADQLFAKIIEMLDRKG